MRVTINEIIAKNWNAISLMVRPTVNREIPEPVSQKTLKIAISAIDKFL